MNDSGKNGGGFEGRGFEGVPSAQQVYADFVVWNNASKPRLASGDTRGGRHRELSAASARLYGLFWKSFATFLAERREGVPWYAATPDDVQAFLEQVQPRSRREKALAITRATSHVTRQRYESLLNRVYQYAVASGIAGLQRSPVQLSQVPGKTKREDEDSFFLHAQYRAQLMQAIPTQGEGFEARDAAMVCLMLCQGLTSAEIASLQGRDVEWAPAQAPDEAWVQDHTPNRQIAAPLALYVPSISRQAQGRRLELDALSQRTLQRWIHERAQLLNARADDLLFVGKRGELSAVRIYEVARSHILSVLVHPSGQSPAQTTLAHAGPMALRTSALMHWFNTLQDPHEVIRRAGLVDLKSLQRIARHGSEDARARLTQAINLLESDGAHTAQRDIDVAGPGLFD